MATISSTCLLTALFASVALWTSTGQAQEKGRSSEAGGDPIQGTADTGALRAEGAKRVMPKQVEGASTREAPMFDPAALSRAYSAVTRSREGEETTAPVSEALQSAIEESVKAPADKEAASAKDTGKDPAFADEEASRKVVGGDDRIQVMQTTTFPFTTIGYVSGKSQSGQYTSCSGALIGPRTVLTAAQCLYVHEDGGWLDEFIFVPAMSSPENIPYGGFDYDTVTIMQGYVDNYKTDYADVLSWDLGILTLREPVGDSLGWLGYGNVEGLGDFSANLVGYPADKPEGTMWRTTCDVLAEDVYYDVFGHTCDTAAGSSGSPLYFYDQQSKNRQILGVTVAESAGVNFAVRLNAANVEWINSVWK